MKELAADALASFAPPQGVVLAIEVRDRSGAPIAGKNFVARLERPELMAFARKRLRSSQLWGNPDCGLKTRKWEEVRPALVNMVAAARELRVASAPVDR